ncbi:MAG: hypothetical protein ACRDY1_07550, partial [Acidimicrobiales bacterium]
MTPTSRPPAVRPSSPRPTSPRPLSPRPLSQLPKAHLHVHLEGAMRRDTLFDLCDAQGTARPIVGTAYATFADFMVLYRAARQAIVGPD